MAKPAEAKGRPDGLPFFDEVDLQQLIAKEPSRVGATRPATVAREVRVPPMVGSADVVVVEADGTITIVECKLHKSSEGHGAVIGQALSYAAGLHGLDYAGFKERFERGKRARPGSLTEPFEGLEGWGRGGFGEAVEARLDAGEFRVVIAADELSEQLKVILAFLGDHPPGGITLSGYEVYPRAPGENRPKLTVEAFVAEIRRFHGDAAADPAEALLRWASSEGLTVSFGPFEAQVSADDTLFRIKRYREVRVSVDKISRQLNHKDAGTIERLNRDLDDLGAERDAKKAKIQLNCLDAQAFISLMRWVVEEIGS